MKKLILLLVVSLLANQFLSAQNVGDSLHKLSADQRQDLLEKSRRQKSGAITLLVVGGATMIVGAVGVAANALDESGNTYAVVFLVGTAMSLGSIPLFIASHRNKNKAMVSVRLESIPLANFLPGKKQATGVGIVFNIGTHYHYSAIRDR